MTIKNFIKKLIPSFLINWYHFILAFLGVFFYGFPSRKMTVIGVTGTKGKSTVIHLVSKIFEEAGFKIASISSARFRINDKEWPNTLKMTMPGRFQIQKFLREALNQECCYAVLEVTSEGIRQYRHKFIKFHTAVFTNLAPEHIESHGSFEKYRDAKAELFKTTLNTHIINLDDQNAEYFLQFKAEKEYGFRIINHESRIKSRESGITENMEIVKAEKIELKTNNSSFIIHNSLFNISLIGEFNIYNALAAICVGLSQKINLETIKTALEKIEGVPGRMEIVIGQPFTVIVDYAHTPDSLEKVYQTIKNFKSPEAKMIGILGAAGGGRDKWKRPEMGKIAMQYCDHIILTNEDPYDENPEAILEQIASGFLQLPVYEKILDRREAISRALSLAEQGDIIIITGKGCEPWMCVAGGKKIPWDDRKIVLEEFSKLKKS